MNTFSEKGKSDWNRFVVENNGSFLQSWEWGEFQKSLGRKIWRLGEIDEWLAMIVQHDLPLGKSYLYCPGGPIMNLRFKNYDLRFKNFLDDVTGIGRQEKAIFLKIEPFVEINAGENGSPSGEPFSKYWADSGLVESDGGQRIRKTLVLDLAESEGELLAEMKQKTRYNIRVAEKHGVRVRISDRPEKDFEEFWRLMQETAKRDRIRCHPKDYYSKQLSLINIRENGSPAREPFSEYFGDEKNAAETKLFLAEFENKVIAANVVMFFDEKTIYLHGASDYEKRHLMAPYLLQWEQIKEAKRCGYAQYDFWGLDEIKWPGVTRFKKGFGGHEIEQSGAYDYVFQDWWYGIYKIAKKLF